MNNKLFLIFKIPAKLTLRLTFKIMTMGKFDLRYLLWKTQLTFKLLTKYKQINIQDSQNHKVLTKIKVILKHKLKIMTMKKFDLRSKKRNKLLIQLLRNEKYQKQTSKSYKKPTIIV